MNFLRIIALISSLIFVLHLQASPTFKNGDLIFQASNSSQADAIMWATGSQYSHVGIIEIDRGQEFVIEAIKTVSRTPLKSWINRGRGAKYTVLRSDTIPQVERDLIVTTARGYVGIPYDPFFTFENKEIYCSELIHLAYKKVGHSIGKIQKVSDLNIDHASVKSLVQARWKRHPLCKTAKDFGSCWSRILDDKLVSPEAVSADNSLTKVFSNF